MQQTKCILFLVKMFFKTQNGTFQVVQISPPPQLSHLSLIYVLIIKQKGYVKPLIVRTSWVQLKFRGNLTRRHSCHEEQPTSGSSKTVFLFYLQSLSVNMSEMRIFSSKNSNTYFVNKKIETWLKMYYPYHFISDFMPKNKNQFKILLKRRSWGAPFCPPSKVGSFFLVHLYTIVLLRLTIVYTSNLQL